MKLEDFGALIKANALFDDVAADMQKLHDQIGYRRLIDQQIASADSIAANIEEGFGRSRSKEYAQFLVYSRGSAQETRGRYGRMKHWLPKKDILARQALCDEIIKILSATIKTLRAK